MKPSINFTRIHFIGIGGSGMSSLAEIMQAWGFVVTGSDSHASEIVARLQNLGITISIGHSPLILQSKNTDQPFDAVIYSSAIPMTNVEIIEAKKKGIPIIRRAEMMGEILRGKYSFGVAGTHGKTTTTTMLGCIWKHAGKEPTLLAGGTTIGENLSAIAGNSSVFIFEADEFDRSFLAMRATSAIIGNIDSDHLDCYGNFGEIEKAFLSFVTSLPFFGRIILNSDDQGVAGILPKLAALRIATSKLVTYGINSECQYRATQIQNDGQGMRFSMETQGKTLGEIEIKVPGLHNVYNALAAATLSLVEGLTFSEVACGLAQFQGVKRRLEYKGQKAGIHFYDDYAHHPTEVSATLQAARLLGSGRLIAVFQPHLFSRTQQLFLEFAKAFTNCDEIFVTAIYPARENPIPGVEGFLITDALKSGLMSHENVHYIDSLHNLSQAVCKKLHPGDVLITMGAGDIGTYCVPIMESCS